MTEMVIVSALVLVPLFLMMPMLGKIIDIRHSAIQAARYEAWEYTVWYANNNNAPQSFTRAVPVKSLEQVKKEARQRFFSQTHLPLKPSDRQRGWDLATARNLWRDHKGLPLYTYTRGSGERHDLEGPNNGPYWAPLAPIGRVFDGVKRILSLMFQVLERVARAVGANMDFSILNRGRTEGYFKTDVVVPVRMPDFPFGLTPADRIGVRLPTTLTVRASAGVVANGWSAGGTAHTRAEVNGLVPTAILDNPVINTALDVLAIAATVAGIPSTSLGTIEWGYVAHDAVHPDRLEGDDRTHVCVPRRISGVCHYGTLPTRRPRPRRPSP